MTHNILTCKLIIKKSGYQYHSLYHKTTAAISLSIVSTFMLKISFLRSWNFTPTKPKALLVFGVISFYAVSTTQYLSTSLGMSWD